MQRRVPSVEINSHNLRRKTMLLHQDEIVGANEILANFIIFLIKHAKKSPDWEEFGDQLIAKLASSAATPAESTLLMDERQEFEVAMKDRRLYPMQERWEGWLARAATPAESTPPTDEAKALAQKLFEAVWFKSQQHQIVDTMAEILTPVLARAATKAETPRTHRSDCAAVIPPYGKCDCRPSPAPAPQKEKP
jgi:hypothetical protein